MANLLEQAIDCNDGDHAAKLIPSPPGNQSDDVVGYVFGKIAERGVRTAKFPGNDPVDISPRRGYSQS
jgi:hypothetical protein